MSIKYFAEFKSHAPSVLLLYSYDCQSHVSAVQSLALLLQNALGCVVMADFWASQEIAERGTLASLPFSLLGHRFLSSPHAAACL